MKAAKCFTAALMAGLVTLGMSASAWAMNYSPVEKLGRFYTAKGGPTVATANGYSKKTPTSLTFGTGKYAMTIKFSNMLSDNRKISKFEGAYIEGKKLNISHINGDIYLTKGDNGIPAYILIGGTGMGQDFYLVAKFKGENWTFINIDVLKQYIPDINGLDHLNAVRLMTPASSGNSIIVPLEAKNGFTQEITYKGEFRFIWDDAAGWFGIEKVDY